ncbi:hypothetical protein AYI68_g3459 [Smittium mucronatum]|uniref:Uncharacterized protein n=1 Tax=Smittium mucronatum TaxID=133383 RepID=A0A1R0GZV4_9FUNG|nr:hypothetical protein AYI68_g3459 [Smittium mucronatum]
MWAATRLPSLTNTIRSLNCDIFEIIRGLYVLGLTSRISELFFTDDPALLAESETDMQISLNQITDWSNKWEMTENASKCGKMNFAVPQ